MTLTGRVQGKTRDDLISQATTEARTYYDTNCVSIQLSDEKAQTDYIDTGDILDPSFTPGPTTYTADYQANIKHDWNTSSVARAACVHCGTPTNEDHTTR